MGVFLLTASGGKNTATTINPKSLAVKAILKRQGERVERFQGSLGRGSRAAALQVQRLQLVGTHSPGVWKAQILRQNCWLAII